MRSIPAVNERALVIGGAGAAGNAWAIGVVAGLLDAGLDVTEADLIVGTSSGSTAAAQLTGGTAPAELYAATQAALPSGRPGPGGPHGGRGPLRPVAEILAQSDAIIAASADVADMRRRLGAAALELEAASDGSRSAQWRAIVEARLPGARWPEQNLLVTAVDARTGEPVVFDRRSGVDLVDAVAASTSGPGAPPYRIGDDRYIDGAYRANVNADLAAGYARVLVLSPFGERTRVPLEWGTGLAAQVDELRAHGSRVETIFPEGDAAEVFGPGGNQTDLSTRAPVARAGYEQGRAIAERLAELWR